MHNAEKNVNDGHHNLFPSNIFQVFDKTYNNETYDNERMVAPIDESTPTLEIKQFSLLNEKEIEFYRKNTWNPLKTLKQNIKILIDDFMKTCVDHIDDILPVENGVILKIGGQSSPILLASAQIEELKQCNLVLIFNLMAESPLFCKLIRVLLTKYKMLPRKPQKAVFLLTKTEACHSSYNTVHHVLNLKTIDQEILSALDCTKHKMLFGSTVFHEMLHWCHKISDPADSGMRCKSTNCICRRLRDYLFNNFSNRYFNKIVEYFSNDEEYYTMYGLKEENGELVLDTLCEAAYTYEQHRYIRGSHVTFKRHFPDERDFILNARDSSLLRFFQNNPPLEFGKGEFKCSDLNENFGDFSTKK
jgi:hypothetical protein